MRTEKFSKKLKSMEGVCVPTAFWNICKKKNVLSICKQHGWSEKRGMFDHEWKKAAISLGLVLTVVPYKGKIKSFLKDYSIGTYIVTVHAHMLVVRDGKMVDPRYRRSGLYRNILGVWQVQ